MSTMKQWLIIGISFGVGLAVTLALIFGLFMWYESKPKKPKPWDSKSITAVYDTVDTEGDNNGIVFYYTLQNNTDYDYKMLSNGNITIMGKLKRQNSLSGDSAENQFLKSDVPTMIPAKQRERFAIHLNYPPYSKKLDAEASNNEREEYKKELVAFLNEKLPNLNGFVIFDEVNRYQIDFPKNW